MEVVCPRRCSQFWLSFLLVLVLAAGISSGVSAQESLSSSLTDLKKILNEAETLSKEQTEKLLSLERDNRRLLELLRQQDVSYQMLSNEHNLLQTSFEQQSQLLRDLRLQHSTEIADLEAKLLRSRIIGVGGTAVGYAAGRFHESLR